MTTNRTTTRATAEGLATKFQTFYTGLTTDEQQLFGELRVWSTGTDVTGHMWQTGTTPTETTTTWESGATWETNAVCVSIGDDQKVCFPVTTD